MYNKEQARKVAPLVNNPQVWDPTVEYLKELQSLTLRGLVMAQSEQEMFRLQGKAALLEMLLSLKNNYTEVMKNGA
jgi:hypothetical protein